VYREASSPLAARSAKAKRPAQSPPREPFREFADDSGYFFAAA
jgi:hypothetical protein